jgi:adenine-specific DNA-methyltransferase
MPQPTRYEQQFTDALKAIFIGASVEGDSGYINLMKIKATYFEGGVFPQLMRDIDAACKPFEKSFREELFDKLYDFFRRYFSESGSIYFRHTAASEGIYERVYTDDRDVMLFWKTHMLYYVKTDRLFNSMAVVVDGERSFFDVSGMELKRANEKRELIYEFRRRDPDGRLVFAVSYSEKGRKTKTEDLLAAVRKTGAPVDEETLEKAFRVFEKQSEVDYFINKDAQAFLEEQFDLWMYQYLFRGESAFTETRLRQLQAIKVVAYKIIGFIARFEDELVRVWNKPKFVLNSHYIITLDKILDADAGLTERIFSHAGMAGQVAEWRELGMLDAQTFEVSEGHAPVTLSGSAGQSTQRRATSEGSRSTKRDASAQTTGLSMTSPQDLWDLIQATDLTAAPLHPRYRFLPLDTRHFPDLELDILALFDDVDAALDGWLVHSENYQALNTLLPKFRGRVKAIYIDPPYNTDAGPIDYANDYRNSSWLSLIENRLQVCKPMLSDEGILCVTIDDYQVHELGKLLDGVFGRENQLGTLVIRNNPSGRSTVKGISICHEYAFFYQSTDAARLARLPRTEKQLERFAVEEGERVNWQNFRKGGGAVTYRAERPKQFYPIYVNPKDKTLRIPSLSWNASKREWNILESAEAGEIVLWPIDEKGKERVWSLNHESAVANISDLEIRPTQSGGVQVFRRHKPSEGVLPRSWWDKNTYAAREHGSAALKDLFGESYAFSFAKSPFAVQDCIWVAGLDDDSDNQVLDFFAGSGTTAHAVMNLNRADGGSRKYILVEMGEHFNTVILPRVKKIAFSDKWKDGKANGGQGMSHFVKYYDLEQYEDTLRRARYDDHAAPLFAATLDELTGYVFLRDLKLLDAVEVDVPGNRVAVALDKLYPGIDLAETLSCLTGKWIKRITRDAVEFADGSTASLAAPGWEDVKGLVWW